jgi:hypothetical protein
MGIGAGQVAGELHAGAPQHPSPRNGCCHQYVANALPPLVGMYMDRLDLGAQRTPILKMAKDDELADPDNMSINFGNQESARPIVDFGQGGNVWAEITVVFLAFNQCTVFKQLDKTIQICLHRVPNTHIG